MPYTTKHGVTFIKVGQYTDGITYQINMIVKGYHFVIQAKYPSFQIN